MRIPNPIREDGVVMCRFVPCPSVDTPEQILEHYRDMWSNSMTRAYQQRRLEDRNRLMAQSELWKSCFDIAEQVVQSYRFAMGNGLLIPFKKRQGGHITHTEPFPLTCPGEIHLISGQKPYIYCERADCRGETVVASIKHVTCPDCIAKYYRTKHQRKHPSKISAYYRIKIGSRNVSST